MIPPEHRDAWGEKMRGTDETSESLFSYVDLEDRIPPRHPLRKITLLAPLFRVGISPALT